MTNKFFRVISSVVALLLVFTLCACGSNSSASGSPSESESPSPSDTASASPTDSATPAAVFTITYDGNGATSGTAPVDSSSYSTGSSATVLDNSGGLALEGSTFNGWNTSADGSGDKYAANDSLTMGSAAVTLYAQWASSASTSPSDSPSDSPSNSPSDSPSPSASDDSGNTNAKDTAVPDKTTVASGGTVSFVVTTSQDVKQIQTYIDGVAGKKHTDYTDGSDTRTWNVSITFSDSGSRKVRFKCTLKSGTTAYVPSKSVVIKVTGSSSSSTTSTTYSVTPTSEKDISADQSVTYTVTTPSSITSVCAVVDSVKQAKVTTASSTSGGSKKWTIKITFHKTGTRSVKFIAYQDSTVEKTFPSTALTVVVS